jgi:NTE family protein
MTQFKNLVFEGGGVKGIAYAGALKVLEEYKNAKGEKIKTLPEIKRVAGTSAGAITAALVALGAGSKDVEDIVGGTKFREFMDDSFLVIRDINRLLHDYGWYKGDAFSAWMQKQVYALCQDSEITFSELAQKASPAKSQFKELFVVGTNLSMQMPVVYSAEMTPDFPVWEAVRISMSIPLFFAAVKLTQPEQVFVDGGVTWNYPLDLFDDKKYLVNPGAGVDPKEMKYTRYNDEHFYNRETLGFRVDTKDEIQAEKDSWRLPPVEIRDFFDYAKALVCYMGDMANKMHLHKNDWDRTVFIDASGVKSTEFDLTQLKVNMLVQNGEDGAKAYFKWFDDLNANPPPLNKIP